MLPLQQFTIRLYKDYLPAFMVDADTAPADDYSIAPICQCQGILVRQSNI